MTENEWQKIFNLAAESTGIKTLCANTNNDNALREMEHQILVAMAKEEKTEPTELPLGADMKISRYHGNNLVYKSIGLNCRKTASGKVDHDSVKHFKSEETLMKFLKYHKEITIKNLCYFTGDEDSFASFSEIKKMLTSNNLSTKVEV